MSTATLDQDTEARALQEFQNACLRRIAARPSDRKSHDAILDLYLETLRRLGNGWTLNSVLTNSLIRLSHL